MAYGMIPNPINDKLKAHAEPDGDEPKADITESPEQSDMTHVKDFVGALDDKEFAYLQDCIEARLKGEDKPSYKSPDEVKDEMDAQDDTRPATKNDGDGDEIA